MAQHDRYDEDLLKQLTRIANSLESINKKIPDASRLYFGQNLLGGLAIGYNRDDESEEKGKKDIKEAVEKCIDFVEEWDSVIAESLRKKMIEDLEHLADIAKKGE